MSVDVEKTVWAWSLLCVDCCCVEVDCDGWRMFVVCRRLVSRVDCGEWSYLRVVSVCVAVDDCLNCVRAIGSV
jgi:hypothetical protein